MLPVAGAANLAVDEEVKTAVNSAVEKQLRAVKVTAEPKEEKIKCSQVVQEGASIEEDFKSIAATLEDSVPCLVLIRLIGSTSSAPEAEEGEWGMIQWAPDNSPVKLRMLCASSHKTIKQAFPSLVFKEYHASEMNEINLSAFVDSTRKFTKDDRRKAMTREERDVEDAKERMKDEQKKAPKKLAGLVSLQIGALDSFNDAMRQLKEEQGKAVLAKLDGAKGEEVSGETLDGISTPTDLKGKLPAEEPRYVVMRPAEGRVLLISWLPDNAPAKMKMKCSTFKSSVLELVKELLPDLAVNSVEVSEEDDLTDSLADAPATKGSGEEAAAEASAGPVGAGFRPPPGAMALPGMGGRGIPLPGMGPRG